MDKSIYLSFEYSKTLEKERIINTIKRLGWYKENKYNVDLIGFPKVLDRENIFSVSDTDILNAIDAEYDETKFVESEKSLKELFSFYHDQLVIFLNETKLSVISPIVVQLTMYGMAGSYSLPNKAIVNVSKFYSVGLMRNVLHEIVHLHIQHLIDTYKIGQWQKERIVDLLMEKLVPKLARRQRMPIDTEKIDQTFEAYYPNVSHVLEVIGTEEGSA